MASLNKVQYFQRITQLLHRIQVNFIPALVGKSPVPLLPAIKKAMLDYWSQIKPHQSIGYGELQGEEKYRKILASALSKQYDLSFSGENVFFTVGGMSALNASFYAIQTLFPGKTIVTTRPYYPGYFEHRVFGINIPFHFVDIFKAGETTLTHKSLAASLKKIKKSSVGAFLFCDPNNPLGTTPGREEWKKIASILRQYPKTIIILDEAFSEMTFQGAHVSLASVAPDLIDRIIIIRTATKGLSASGERMAVAITKHKAARNLMVEHHYNYNLHAPKSQQYAYAYALQELASHPDTRISKACKENVMFLYGAFKEKGLLPQGLRYTPNSSFFLVCDLSHLKGRPLHKKAKKVLVNNKSGVIETDVDVAMHLAFDQNLMITPLSFFGAESDQCFMRISCGGTKEELTKIRDTLLQTKNSLPNKNLFP